jgi:septum formation protein
VITAGDRRSGFPSDFHLFLASQSPRRRELLAGLGVPFTVVGSRGEERSEGAAAEALAEANALTKMEGAVLPEGVPAGSFVLGTDTVVVIDGLLLGKPSDEADARTMLGRLSGRTHRVVSGVAVGRTAPRTVVSGWAATEVHVRSLSRADIDAYLASGEWADKAGAYAIQGLGALLVHGIRGEYANVVGLPLGLVADLFRSHRFDLLHRVWLA